MPLPLPFKITDAIPLGDEIHDNFTEIAKQFPFSRKHMKIETPHNVGDLGEPAFEHGWLNYDATTFQGARFWKDPMGIVHVEGLVKSGTIATSVFTLPAGYRPATKLVWAAYTSTGVGRLDVYGDGSVFAASGGTGYYSLSVINFKQEQ